jgi:hypothetical protein
VPQTRVGPDETSYRDFVQADLTSLCKRDTTSCGSEISTRRSDRTGGGAYTEGGSASRIFVVVISLVRSGSGVGGGLAPVFRLEPVNRRGKPLIAETICGAYTTAAPITRKTTPSEASLKVSFPD